MKRLFRFTHRAAIHFVLFSLLGLALLLSTLRLWLLPAVRDFRRPLESRIGALIGETVRIDALSARLHGFRPELSLGGFHILDSEGRSALTFSTVRLNLDTFRTLAAGDLRFDRIEVVGPRLSLRRRQDGSLAVTGLTLQEQPPAWLLTGRHISLRDAEVDWQDMRTGAPPLVMGKVNLSLRNNGARHRLSAGFVLPESLGRSLRLILDTRGDLFSAAGWGGTVYLEGKGLDASRLATALPPLPFGLRSGSTDARLWARWRQGSFEAVAGELHIRNPVLGHLADSGTDSRLAMKALDGGFRWERQPGGWRLDLNRFRPALHQAWPDTRLAVAVNRTADGALASLSAGASHLDLADLRLALESLALLDRDTGASLHALAPRGTLENPRFFHSPSALPGRRWAFCGRFRDLGLNPQGTQPGIAGLDGEACGTAESGGASLTATRGKLALPGLGIKKPIGLEPLRAELSWQQTGTDWTLTIPSLSAHNADFTAESRGRLTLPKTGEGSPSLELESWIGGMELTALPQYLPAGLIPDTASWLRQALAGGKISRWNLRFHGPTHDFPFYKQEGTFESDIDLRNLDLRFHPAWPPLTQADAQLKFRGPRMEATLHQGRLGKGELIEAQGSIEDMNRNPWLSATGTIRAGVTESLDYLAHSPLREIPERLRRHLGTSGNADIALNLRVPLGSTAGATAVAGTATFHDAGLRIDGLDLGIQNLEGPLHFGQGGLAAEGIKARFLGEPAQIAIKQGNGEITVGLNGRAGIPALQQQFPAAPWGYARGAVDYRLSLHVPETLDTTDAPLRMTLETDLAGIALDLPVPLGKAESATRALAIETRLGGSGDLPVALTYGTDLRAQLRFTGRESNLRLASGAIAWGRPLPAADPAPGLSLSARLDALDLGEWLRWWKAMPGGGGAPLVAPRRLDFAVRKLAFNGAPLGAFALVLNREAERWQGRIETDHGSGQLSVSVDSVRVDLDTLELPEKLDGILAERAPSTVPGGQDEIDPATVPGLKFQTRRLLWKKTDLGPLELETERHAHGMILKKLTLTGKTHTLEVHGDWTRTPRRLPSTHIEGKGHLDSLGDFLAALGRNGKVRDTPSDLEFTLDWPGSPYRFSAGSVAGSFHLNLGKGALLEVEPGLGRVIGVLNLNSFWRRLALDFSDLFGKGWDYDGITGSFRIGNGQAVTESFLIDAASARIIANGRVGLVDRDLDQTVAVIPHTSAALPIAGALAGGPAVGAAVFVAQELIGEQVDNITATRYSVRGPWENPTITRIHGNLPLDVIDRAWSGVKNLPVFGNPPEEPQK